MKKFYAVIDTNVVVSAMIKWQSVPGSIMELPDVKDRVFYEFTMEIRKTEDAYLVTGNIRHFPAEHFIVTAREMLDIILGTV